VEINLSPTGGFPKPIERGSLISDRVESLLVQAGASGGMDFTHIPLRLIPHLRVRDYKIELIFLFFYLKNDRGVIKPTPSFYGSEEDLFQFARREAETDS